MEKTEFERLLESHKGPVERFVKFKLPTLSDAQDILQEVYLAAYTRFHTLKNRDAFLPWILQIARNKCRDFYRTQANRPLALEDIGLFVHSRFGIPKSCGTPLCRPANPYPLPHSCRKPYG